MKPLVFLGLVLLGLGYVQASITFLGLGDWGVDPYPDSDEYVDEEDEGITYEGHGNYGLNDQMRIAQWMKDYASTHTVDFITAFGDNFYPKGVTSLDDPRWDDVWKNVYDGPLDNLVWYACLGNHDHEIDGRSMYQVNKTFVEPRWYMPDLFYDTYFEKDDIKIHLIVLDTDSFYWDPFDRQPEQLQFINDSISNGEPSDWTFVMGHHPTQSCGRYAPGESVLKRDVQPVMELYDVDIYMNGHDHNLQHIVKNESLGKGPDYVVSGGGGRSRYAQSIFLCDNMHEGGHTLNYFGETYGFNAFVVEKTSMTVYYYGDTELENDYVELYNFTRVK